ncbi:MAG: AAA family ATPase [Mesorhizobium sp.]
MYEARVTQAPQRDAGQDPAAALNSYLIYAQFFGLRERPFSLLPNPDYLYWTEGHTLAFAMLEYGLVTFAPITVITGEVGAGKTTLIHHLLRSIPRDLRIGLISNAQADRGKLIDWALHALGEEQDTRTSYVKRFKLLEEIVRNEYDSGRGTVLIVDEAQNLSKAMLEELRCFSNMNGSNEELLQIVLVGQPELRRMISEQRMPQFAQRVSAQFHLTGMPESAIGSYVAHRLKVAGADHEIFLPNSFEPIYRASRGLPRIINQICDYALVYAFAQERQTIDGELIESVVSDRRAQSRPAQPTGLS